MSGDSPTGQGDLFQQVDGGSSPTSPLQISPKDLEVFRIPMPVADAFSIKHHYLHRTAKNSKIAFGVKVRQTFPPAGVDEDESAAQAPGRVPPRIPQAGGNELLGILIWGAPVARLNQEIYMELRRMYLPDSLPKNSESRVLSICARIIHKLFPGVSHLISYSDESVGHQGTIYKAAGWELRSVVEPDPEGGWSKHKRHKRKEFGRKRKWVYPLMCRTQKDTKKRLKKFASYSPKINEDSA